MTLDHEPESLQRAVQAFRAGLPVIVLDDADREDEGDLVLAAQHVTAETVNLMIRDGGGLICVAAAPEIIDRLDLPPMVEDNTDTHGTAFTVSVDGTTTGTGISAADRAATIRALADPATGPHDLRRPGHVFPLRAVEGGVLQRPGHTEAAVDLARLAGTAPVAAICEVLDESGAAADRSHLEELATRLAIPLIHVRDVAEAMAAQRPPARATLPTSSGDWTMTALTAEDGVAHLALVLGEPEHAVAPLVRVHSECLTGDVFGSYRCDCGEQLDAAMSAIADAGVGVVLYLRGHEGRGVGLVDKLRAYALQEAGHDTVDANTRLGLPVDARDYRGAAELLTHLGIDGVTLLTNSPAKVAGLRRCGITVAGTSPLRVKPRPENREYLDTKQNRLGHRLMLPVSPEGVHAC
jgi:3,4-dihydroxy 2-butanone 4-phosphate synthase / GTP cyclohydrolase II